MVTLDSINKVLGAAGGLVGTVLGIYNFARSG